MATWEKQSDKKKTARVHQYPGRWLPNLNIIFEEIEMDDGSLAYARSDKPGEYEAKFVLGNETFKPAPKERLPWKLPGPPMSYTSSELLFELVKGFLKVHVEFGKESYYDVAVAFALASWLFQSFRAFPYIWAVAPKESGKTTFLECMNEICFRPSMSASTTMPGMSKNIHQFGCSALIDEAQVNEDPTEKSVLQAVLNSGYRQGGRRQLSGGGSKGEWYPKFENLYSPKIMASTHLPWPALGGRCLIFKMVQTQRKDLEPTLTNRFYLQGRKLRQQPLQYRFDNLRKEPPERITSLDDAIDTPRLREIALPLLTVAPLSAHESILGYLRELEKERLSEDQISEEAEYVEALISIKDPPERVPIEMIRKALMGPKELDSEQWLPAPKTVSMKLRELGFKPAKNAGPNRTQRGIFWDPGQVKKLAERYLPQTAQSASENMRGKAHEADEAVSGNILVEKDICNKCYLSKYRSDRTTTRPPVNGTCEDCGEPSSFRVIVYEM